MRVMAVSDAFLNGPLCANEIILFISRCLQEGTASDVTESKIREEPEVAERVAQTGLAGGSFKRGAGDLVLARDRVLERRSPGSPSVCMAQEPERTEGHLV